MSYPGFDQTTFGDWLRQRRQELNLTREQVAQRAICSVETIKKVQANQLVPSQQLAHSLATALEIPPEERAVFIAFARNLRPTSAGSDAPFPVISKSESASIYPSPLPSTARPTLPTAPTSFVGRELEVQTLIELLRRPEVRLVTLTGAPGIGKTRLGVEVGKQLEQHFADGSVFVSLAPVSQPEMLMHAIAQALKIDPWLQSEQIVAAVIEHLRMRQLLLLLDNFEQIINAATQVSSLLATAPGLKILVTSRQLLRLYGEYEFVVAPLLVPEARQPSSPEPFNPEQLRTVASVKLFEQRARAARRDFELNTTNARAVAQLCARLDGLPLALEMAAANLKWQTPAEVLEQINSHLLTLGNERRDLEPRQRTLAGAIDWSYAQLNRDEQELFRMVGVFVGGCSLAAICAIGERRLETGDQRAETTTHNSQLAIRTLQSLVENSLLQLHFTPANERRYIMLSVLREFAYAKLVESGESERVHAAYADWFVRLARQAEGEMNGAQQEYWFRYWDIEINNVRAALTWLTEHEVDRGLELAASLHSYWLARGLNREARVWVDQLLAQKGGAGQSAEMQAVLKAKEVLAVLSLFQQDFSHPQSLANEILLLNQQVGDKRVDAVGMRILGHIALMSANYGDAKTLFDQALALANEINEPMLKAIILGYLGVVARNRADLVNSTLYHDESLAIFEQLGDKHSISLSLSFLSVTAYWRGDYTSALDLANRALAISRGLGDKLSEGYAIDALAMPLFKLGRVEEARALLQTGLSILTEIGDKSGVALMYEELGRVALGANELEQSKEHFQVGLAHSTEVGDRRRTAFCLEGLGRVAIRQTEWQQAAKHFAEASQLRAQIDAPLPRLEQSEIDHELALLRGQIGPFELAHPC